jgi:two-component system, OmpR family, response regulator
MRILIVEDDKSNADYVKDGLSQSGHVVDVAFDGMEGLFLATEQTYDVLIVDRMLPKLDGLALISALRNSGNKTPVLVLSSLSKVEERVKGLRAGGDDYMVKPFAFSELTARIESLTRRNNNDNQDGNKEILQVGDLLMNLLSRVVTRSGKNIALQNREFKLLEFLMRHPDQVITRTMLLEGVWDFYFNPQTNLIDAQVSKLRQKIDKGFEKSLIHTIRGAGYRISSRDE